MKQILLSKADFQQNTVNYYNTKSSQSILTGTGDIFNITIIIFYKIY